MVYLSMATEKKYPIKVIAQKTGLSLHVIRAWEKRYQAVRPERTNTNRRLYSENDLQRLSLLKQATDQGYNIGNIAELPLAELQELVSDKPQIPVSTTPPDSVTSVQNYFEQCMEAILDFDAFKLEAILLKASTALTQPQLINEVVMPILIRIGEMWREGTIRIMHEHMTSAVLKTFLSNLRNSYRPGLNAPIAIVTTPLGQVHELGALIAALVAAAQGWQVIYLGPNLPAEEITAAAVKKSAKVILLSIVYPAEDPFLRQELEKLGMLLPEHVKIIIGGRMAGHYKDISERISVWGSNDLNQFRRHLELIEEL